jgi:predicted nucleotidyltransferase
VEKFRDFRKVSVMGRREELAEELEKITDRLKRDRSVRLILLFGSLARGDVCDESDLDLLVVKETDKKFLDRLDEFYQDAGIAMDIFVYTPAEFERMKERSIIKQTMDEGAILYEA